MKFSKHTQKKQRTMKVRDVLPVTNPVLKPATLERIKAGILKYIDRSPQHHGKFIVEIKVQGKDAGSIET